MDAIVNLVLGALLIVFPDSVVSALGVPPTDVSFYQSILGAVLLGIGFALLIEYRAVARGSVLPSGLGLRGAVAINVSGGVVLAFWLVFGSMELPLRGGLLLWGLIVVLVGLSALEVWRELRQEGAERDSVCSSIPGWSVDRVMPDRSED